MPIELPVKPGPNEYEDLISAVLMGLGHFVECSLKLKEGTSEVLELDTVATPAGPSFQDRRLFEAKTGNSGFGDLFKVYGWMTYLGIKEGCVAHRDEIDKDRIDAYGKIAAETNARCCHFTATSKFTDLAPAAIAIADPLQGMLVSAAWYSKIVQRVAYAAFNRYAKSTPSTLVDDAKKYQSALQQAFFAKSAISRVHALYDAWQKSPNLCGQFITHHAAGADEKPLWHEFNDTHEKLWLQHVGMLEHRARLGIIKNAIDHLIAEETGKGGATVKIGARTISWADMLEHLAPKNFREAMEFLRTHPHRNKIPFLLQLFIEVFGGFYLYSASDDMDVLAAATGIPAAEIPPCLGIIDRFFPTGSGWFYTQKDEICVMKMVPGVYRGVGCFLRTSLYGLKDYGQMYPEQGWLLAKWHNAGYRALEKALKVAPEAK